MITNYEEVMPVIYKQSDEVVIVWVKYNKTLNFINLALPIIYPSKSYHT